MNINNFLKLQEIIIVGNVDIQTKFSELTIDMYRMLQFFGMLLLNFKIEREPNSHQNNSLDQNNN